MMESFDFTYIPKRNAIQRLATSGTTANDALATNIVGVGKIKVVATAAEVQFYFSNDGADTAAFNATGSGNTVGYSLPAGTSEEFYLTKETRIVHIASGAGFITIMRAGKERIGQ